MPQITKMSPSEVAAEHANEAHAPYLKVFLGLAFLTGVEYFYAMALKDHFGILLLGLLLLAAVKAGMVGWYFMHLKFEGKWVYIMLVPAAILAVLLTTALCPDMVLKYTTEENPGEDEVYVMPAPPAEGVLSLALTLEEWHVAHGGCATNVSGSYKLGAAIVIGTILISGVICWTLGSRVSATPPRAAHDLGIGALPLGEFHFEERSGRTVTHDDLARRVWVSAFIFTRCPLSCPRISGVMKRLQERFAPTNVLLVSITVDPANDTVPVLAAYANQFQALPDRWWFLTGSKDATNELVRDRFKLSLMETTAADRADGAETFAHSDRLALVDGGRVVGLFESTDPAAIDELVARATRLAQPQWVRGLPAVNASLNALCALLLITGWLFIRQRQNLGTATTQGYPFSHPAPSGLLSQKMVRAHIACMLLAVITSAVFLTCYLVYHYHAGSMPFRHYGLVRWVYFTILLSHTALATFGVVPLVAVTLLHAARRQFAKHARIARVAFPIWVYVSITGVIIYLLLYHFPTSANANTITVSSRLLS